MRGKFILVALALGLFLVPAGTADACSCAPWSAELMMANGTAVFEGRAVGLGRGNRVMFEVIRRFKGASGQRVTVIVPGGPQMCPVPSFTIGQHYLVAATGPVDALEVDGCNPSRPSADATADLAALARLARRSR